MVVSVINVVAPVSVITEILLVVCEPFEVFSILK